MYTPDCNIVVARKQKQKEEKANRNLLRSIKNYSLTVYLPVEQFSQNFPMKNSSNFSQVSVVVQRLQLIPQIMGKNPFANVLY